MNLLTNRVLFIKSIMVINECLPMSIIPRNFKIDLALNPISYAVIAAPKQINGIDVEMDGKPLVGVNSLHVKSGLNGYTNVVLEMEAKTVIEMVAALVVGVDDDKELFENKILPLLDKSLQMNEANEGDTVDREVMAQVMKTFFVLLIENVREI